MSARKQTVVVEKWVKAPIGQVYQAFTNATVLREWLCDLATVSPRPKGRIYLFWNGDFYSSGDYVEVKPQELVSFTWRTRSDDRATLIEVTFTQNDDAVLVRLAHTIPVNKAWQDKAEGFKQEWEVSLENLRSVLEEGIDLRIANRPLLGIGLSDFSADIAARMGVPVTQGIRLDSIVEGLGADKAGLCKDDVIYQFNGKIMSESYSGLVAAMQGKKAGDMVEVVYYRGPEKKTVQMTLSGRPRPLVPSTPQELVNAARPLYEKAINDLAACFEGFADDEAGARPAPQEWSAKHVLAHLLQGERFNHFAMVDTITYFERWQDDWGGNLDQQVCATVAAFPTVEILFDQWKRLTEETFALVLGLPPEFVAHKHSYISLGQNLLAGTSHTYSHFDQVKNALQASRR
jgi:uncharacterized protein YndB with AHSA1/START domain